MKVFLDIVAIMLVLGGTFAYLSMLQTLVEAFVKYAKEEDWIGAWVLIITILTIGAPIGFAAWWAVERC